MDFGSPPGTGRRGRLAAPSSVAARWGKGPWRSIDDLEIAVADTGTGSITAAFTARSALSRPLSSRPSTPSTTTPHPLSTLLRGRSTSPSNPVLDNPGCAGDGDGANPDAVDCQEPAATVPAGLTATPTLRDRPGCRSARGTKACELQSEAGSDGWRTVRGSCCAHLR